MIILLSIISSLKQLFLININNTKYEEEKKQWINEGKGILPAFHHCQEVLHEQNSTLHHYLHITYKWITHDLQHLHFTAAICSMEFLTTFLAFFHIYARQPHLSHSQIKSVFILKTKFPLKYLHSIGIQYINIYMNNNLFFSRTKWSRHVTIYHIYANH